MAPPRKPKSRPFWYAGIAWFQLRPGTWEARVEHRHDDACASGCRLPEGDMDLLAWGSPTGQRVPAFAEPWHWSVTLDDGIHVLRGGPNARRDESIHHATLGLYRLARTLEKADETAAGLLAPKLPQPARVLRLPGPERSPKRGKSAAEAQERALIAELLRYEREGRLR